MDALHVVLGVVDGLIHLACGLEDVVGHDVGLAWHPKSRPSGPKIAENRIETDPKLACSFSP